MLAAEPGAEAAEAADHLVQREQHPEALAHAAHLGPVALRRHDHAAGALDRLGDERGHALGPERLDARREPARRLQPERLAVHVPAEREPVRALDVLDVRHRAAELSVHRRHAAQRRAGHGAAVVRVEPADHDAPSGLALELPVAPDHPQHRVVGLGAGVREEHAAHPRRRDLGDQARELDRRRVGALEEVVVVRQLAHLRRRRVDQLLAPVAEVHAPQPRHAVEDAVAVGVLQPHAVRAHDDAAAARRERLEIGERMQVVRGVQRAPLVRGARPAHTFSSRYSRSQDEITFWYADSSCSFTAR